MKSRLIGSLFVCVVAMQLTTAEAALLEFVHEWRVLSSDAATATGHITIDDTILLNPGNNDTTVNPFVVAFDITITGALSGNGTFSLSDFRVIWLDTGLLSLDFSQELVGQPTDGRPWGTCFDYDCGDYTVIAIQGSSAPVPIWYFALATNGGEGNYDILELTSFRPIPIPPAVWLFGSGLLGLAGIARRKKTA